MTKSIVRGFAPMVALVPFLGLGTGCDSTDVKLAKAPLVQIPEPKDPEKQPESLRPGAGSSAGMNYDPSGVGGAAPPARTAVPPKSK